MTIKNKLAQTGMGENKIKQVAKNIDEITAKAPHVGVDENEGWQDNLLMQPTEEWDKTDLKGHWGDSVLSMPSKKFKARYDLIDWSK